MRHDGWEVARVEIFGECCARIFLMRGLLSLYSLSFHFCLFFLICSKSSKRRDEGGETVFLVIHYVIIII